MLGSCLFLSVTTYMTLGMLLSFLESSCLPLESECNNACPAAGALWFIRHLAQCLEQRHSQKIQAIITIIVMDICMIQPLNLKVEK